MAHDLNELRIPLRINLLSCLNTVSTIALNFRFSPADRGRVAASRAAAARYDAAKMALCSQLMPPTKHPPWTARPRGQFHLVGP